MYIDLPDEDLAEIEATNLMIIECFAEAELDAAIEAAKERLIQDTALELSSY